MENQSSQRIHMLDVIRGTAIILVVLYHFLYNLEWLFSMHISAFHTEVANFLHFCLLATIITVSGICTGFSRNIFRRGSMLLIAGTVITMFTSVFLPDQQIVFGVLSFFGTMMILYGFVGKYLQKLRGRLSLPEAFSLRSHLKISQTKELFTCCLQIFLFPKRSALPHIFIPSELSVWTSIPRTISRFFRGDLFS